MSIADATQKAKKEIRAHVSRVSPWLAFLVRGGYVAKGILYGFIGVLAAMAAVHSGGKMANQRGAIDTMAQHPLGTPILYAMAVSLAAYSTWQLFGALLNPENEKKLPRVCHVLEGFAYYFFAFVAFEAARGVEDSGAGWTKWTPLLESPLGRVVCVAIGLGFASVGVAQTVAAFKLSFMKELKSGEMGSGERAFAQTVGIVGIVARSIIFLVTGWLFVHAGFDRDATKVGGLSKSMQLLATRPGGHWILLAVAIGFIAYGVHMLVQARFRRIEVGA